MLLTGNHNFNFHHDFKTLIIHFTSISSLNSHFNVTHFNYFIEMMVVLEKHPSSRTHTDDEGSANQMPVFWSVTVNLCPSEDANTSY